MAESLIVFTHEKQPNGSWALKGTVQNVDTLDELDLNATEAQRIVGRIHTVRESEEARLFGKERGRRDILRVVDVPVPDAKILGRGSRLTALPQETASEILSVLGAATARRQQRGAALSSPAR